MTVDDQIVKRAIVDGSVASAAADVGVVARPGVECIVSPSARQAIGPGISYQTVAAAPALQIVVVAATVDVVIASAALDRVQSVIAPYLIGAGAANDEVVAAITDKNIRKGAVAIGAVPCIESVIAGEKIGRQFGRRSRLFEGGLHIGRREIEVRQLVYKCTVGRVMVDLRDCPLGEFSGSGVPYEPGPGEVGLAPVRV